MKKRMALVLSILLCVSNLTACGDASGNASAGTATEGKTKTSSASSVFNGELEQNVTIQVLENDTAISKGYLRINKGI